MIHRREVRVSDAFFAQLDAQFAFERGRDGQPSGADFLLIDLPTIIERFAVEFDQMPMIIDGVPTGRMLISTGVLVPVVAVYGMLLVDDAIELVGLECGRFEDSSRHL